MLLINTNIGQSIFVGSDTSIKLLAISLEDSETRIKVEHHGAVYKMYLKTGVPAQLIDEVIISVSSLLKGGELMAVFAFDAPRRIKIKGSWM